MSFEFGIVAPADILDKYRYLFESKGIFILNYSLRMHLHM